MVTSKAGEQELPADAQAVVAMLAAMGASDYEPRVVRQLVALMHRYLGQVFDDALWYAEQAGRPPVALSVADLKEAVAAAVNSRLSAPPPRGFLADLARRQNDQPLPTPPRSAAAGIALPPEEDCLLADAPLMVAPAADGEAMQE